MKSLIFAFTLLTLAGCLELLKDPFVDARRGNFSQKVQNSNQDDCEGDASDTAPDAMRLLTNVEYDQSVRELLFAPENASAAFFPPDSTGSGFDTGAIRAMTPGMVQSYFDAGQALTSAYVDIPGVSCADRGFDVSCTAEEVKDFAELAFRRPLFSDEAARFRSLPKMFLDRGISSKDAYAASLATVVLSPQFLYRPVLKSGAGLTETEQYAFASKLSYALWASPPDQQLLDLAKGARLSDPSLLAVEVERMLSSPKARSFLGNFTDQWLGTKGLGQAPAARHLAPELIEAYQDETRRFFAEFLEKNINIHHLLDARFTYANARLAQQYDLSYTDGDLMRRVALNGNRRGGLLTQGAFLLLTSNPDGTSPVKRGKWVLERLLCSPPPPPPPGIPTVFAPSVGKALPIRKRLEAHVTGACASCHQRMDPIGLAFENYDMTGKWRDRDEYGTIDARGSLPSGESFADARSLAALIQADPNFARCVTSKAAKYILGRESTKKEQCLINKIAERTGAESYGLKSLLIDLTLSLLNIQEVGR